MLISTTSITADPNISVQVQHGSRLPPIVSRSKRFAACLIGAMAMQAAGIAGEMNPRQYYRHSMERILLATWDCSESRNASWQFQVETAGEYRVHMQPRLACDTALPYLPPWPDLLESAKCLADSSVSFTITVSKMANGAALPILDAEAFVLAPSRDNTLPGRDNNVWFIPANDLWFGPVFILQVEGADLVPGVNYSIEIDLDPQSEIGGGLRVTFELVRFESKEGNPGL